jgi:hypothetical protein
MKYIKKFENKNNIKKISKMEFEEIIILSLHRMILD